MSVVSRVRVESPTLSHETESSQPGKFESSTTLPTRHHERQGSKFGRDGNIPGDKIGHFAYGNDIAVKYHCIMFVK